MTTKTNNKTVQQEQTNDGLLTEQEVARFFNVAPITVKRLRDKGKLRAYIFGARTIRYERAVIDEFLRNAQFIYPLAA